MIPADVRRRWADWGVPWWQRRLAQVLAFAVLFPCFVWTLGVVVVCLGVMAVGRLLPPAWRPAWPEPPVPDPPAAAGCPACRVTLAVFPPDGGVQWGRCPSCGCAARRVCCSLMHGPVWTAWQPTDRLPPNPDGGPGA